jgi:hypothetical protein
MTYNCVSLSRVLRTYEELCDYGIHKAVAHPPLAVAPSTKSVVKNEYGLLIDSTIKLLFLKPLLSVYMM